MEVDVVAHERRTRVIVRRLAPFAVAAVVIAGLVAAIAFAGPNTVQDPNDTRGVLDVKTVRFKHPSGEPPTWKIVTFDGWSARKIWDRGFLYVLLDTGGGENADYAAQVRSDGRRVSGVLYRLGKGDARDVVVTSLSARKPGAASASIRIPLRRLRFGEHRTFYRWWTVTTLSGVVCPAVCIDRAPNTGSVLRYRPGMSPTPTGTPSPTP
jgi:hypothetical protein